jgi:hypothetical protein
MKLASTGLSLRTNECRKEIYSHQSVKCGFRIGIAHWHSEWSQVYQCLWRMCRE